MKFNLYNIPVIFNEEFQIYNHCRGIFFHEIEDLMEDFYFSYHQNMDNIDNAVNTVMEYYSTILKSLVNRAIQLLVQYNILNCNEEIFQEKYFDIYFNMPTMIDLMKEIEAIKEAYSERQYEKAVERASRGQWVGGGYGISGAIKGAVKAGAMNMITDGFRSIGDSYSDNKDRQKVLKILNSLFNNDSVCQGFYFDIKSTGFNIFMCFLNELCENGIISFTSFNEQETNAKFENVIRYKTNSNEILRSVVECVQDNPYEVKYYIYLVSKFGDSNKGVERIAEYLGFKEKIRECKNDIMQDILDMRETNCAEVYKKIETIQKYSIALGINSDREITKLKQLDIDYRTAGSILFNTEEEASTLRKCLKIPENSYEKVCEKIKSLKETEKVLSIDLKEDIDRLEKKEIDYRTVDSILFNTEKEASILRKCLKIPENSYEKVCEKIKSLKETEKVLSIDLKKHIDRLQKKEKEFKIEEYLKMPEDSYEKVCEKIKTLKEAEKSLSVNLKKYIDKLEKKEKDFRTVEKIEYETIYEADKAKNVLSELDNTEKEKFDVLTIEQLLVEKEKAQKYNYHSKICKNYVEKIDKRIAILKDRLSESDRYYNEIKSIDLCSKEAIETFEKNLKVKHEDIKEDILKTLSILKILAMLKENIDSFRIPSEVNKGLSDIETIKSSIKLEKYKYILQPKMLKEVNEKLNYLQSDEYKQQYEKAMQYQISKLKVFSSFDFDFFFSVIFLVIFWLIKGFLYRWFLQGGWIIKGVIIFFAAIPAFATVLGILMYISIFLRHSREQASARIYVSEHPECKTIWNKLTQNGTKQLEKYH